MSRGRSQDLQCPRAAGPIVVNDPDTISLRLVHLRESHIETSVVIEIRDTHTMNITDSRKDDVFDPRVIDWILWHLEPRDFASTFRWGKNDIGPPITIDVTYHHTAARRPRSKVMFDPASFYRIAWL